VKWTPAKASSNIIAYHLYRNGQLYAYIGKADKFTDGNVQSGKTYIYIVKSIDNKGNITTHGKPTKVVVGKP
jgi:hypothetical protein